MKCEIQLTGVAPLIALSTSTINRSEDPILFVEIESVCFFLTSVILVLPHRGFLASGSGLDGTPISFPFLALACLFFAALIR